MKLLFLDTETTGNGPEDRICQLAVVVANEELEIEEVFDHLVKPPVPIGIEAMSIHHITPEMVDNAPPIRFTEGWKRLKELNSPDNVLIIHNAQYDLEMLKREGFNSHYRLVDTFRVLKQLYPEGRYGLQYNRYYFQLYKREEELLARLKEKGLELELRPHSALADTLVLYLLVEHLVREGHSIEEMIELTQKPIIYEKFYWGKHKYRPIAEVIVEDPEYIETLLEDENLEEDWRVSIQYHLERVEAKPVYRFQLGKYRGMTPEDVARIDWDYLKWAYHNLGGLSRGFRERIAEILKEGKPPADPYLEEEV